MYPKGKKTWHRNTPDRNYPRTIFPQIDKSEAITTCDRNVHGTKCPGKINVPKCSKIEMARARYVLGLKHLRAEMYCACNIHGTQCPVAQTFRDQNVPGLNDMGWKYLGTDMSRN